MWNGAQVAKHKSSDSCWIVIHGKVYDVTKFLDEHPGGRSILLKQAGADATPEFDKIHSLEIIEDLPAGSYLGELDPATVTALNAPVSKRDGPKITTTGSSTNSSSTSTSSNSQVPAVLPISMCIRAHDFRAEAQKVLSPRSWIYVTSSANSGQSLRDNADSWAKVTFRPRVLRDVADVSTRTAILGQPSIVPFFIPPMGTMGMSHPNGEFEMYRGSTRKGVHAILSTASTKSVEAVMASYEADLARAGGKDKNPSRLFFQLYIPTDKSRAVELIRKVKKAGYKGLFVTVDTAILGKRTEDRRRQAEEALEDGDGGNTTATTTTTTAAAAAAAAATTLTPVGTDGSENPFGPAIGARPVPGQISPMVTWDDLNWIRQEWPGPIVLKGIQTAEDARLAAENNCQGIVLSNHGGRQQQTAPSALATLLEIRTYCPEVLKKIEVYVDGGCQDGADILKALALGATAVGIGRPFLFAMAAYGSEGVERLIDILTEELTIGMKLLGVTSIDQLRPEMVNASRLLNEMWRPELPSILSRL